MIHFTLDEADRQLVVLALATLAQRRPGLTVSAQHIADQLQGGEWYQHFLAGDPEIMPRGFPFRNKPGAKPEFSVINLKDNPSYLPEDVVYVGRRFHKWPAHPLGNPFKIATEDNDARIACVHAYRHWLETRPDLHKQLERLWQATRNGALPLACWCYPKPCHAYVLADMLADYVRDKQASERKEIPFESLAETR